MLTCVASALTQVVALPLLCSQASAERPAPSLQVSLARKGGLCAGPDVKGVREQTSKTVYWFINYCRDTVLLYTHRFSESSVFWGEHTLFFCTCDFISKSIPTD